jgi:hypothetical protein
MGKADEKTEKLRKSLNNDKKKGKVPTTYK